VLVSFYLLVGLLRLGTALTGYFIAVLGVKTSSSHKSILTGAPTHANQYMRCSCGGRLESLDRFDWVSEAERADADVRDEEEPTGHASV
jgi:hypothetical protein